ncbi:MAG: DMP19 family protein [Sulfobacillus sp.]
MGYWDRVGPIWDNVSFDDGAEIFLAQYAALPYVPAILLAAHVCQAEVVGGGFREFFLGSAAVLAPEGAWAFHVLEMPQVAAVIEEAMEVFGSEYPRELRERTVLLETLEESVTTDPSAVFIKLNASLARLILCENDGFDAAANMYAYGSPYG